MKINEKIYSKSADYIRDLKIYVCAEFDAIGIFTKNWEWFCEQSPGHLGGGGVTSSIRLKIFSKTDEIEGLDYSTNDDRKVLEAFITDSVEKFMANNKWPEDSEISLSHVDFWYPEECSKAFSISISLNTLYK